LKAEKKTEFILKFFAKKIYDKLLSKKKIFSRLNVVYKVFSQINE
jgi:hypothetical protein